MKSEDATANTAQTARPFSAEGKLADEDALRKSRDELAQKVAEHTAELVLANERLQQEIKERELAQRHTEASNALLRIATEVASRKEYLDGVVSLIKEWSGCRCLGIRVLDEQGNIPYESYVGYSTEFMEKENRLSLTRDNCACVRVITGEAEPRDNGCMSPGGSFVSNDSVKLLKDLPKEELKEFRGVCIKSGFLSFAVVPIRNNDTILGAIHLADERAGMVERPLISFLESLSRLIGEGIAKFSIKDALKKREELIKEQSRKLDAFFEHSITPFVFLDKDFNFIRVNNAYAACCGKTIEEFAGHNHFEFYPDVGNESIFKEVVRTKKPYQAVAKPFHFPDHPEWGVTYWDWTLVPVLDSSGSVEFLAFSLNDVTARRRAEERIDSSMAKLKESNEALQEFASIASHDMQEPLRKVISFGNMLKKKYGDSIGEDGRDYLDRMLNATTRMNSLLKSLLDYSRITTKAEPHREVELAGVLNEVLSDLEVRIQKTGGKVEVGDLPVVAAEHSQMHQLFQNLIGNALKFHKESEKPLVRVSSTAGDKGTLQIVVEDNGIGFDEKDLDRIFTPFQRLHGRSSRYEGTGMGLAICKKIVERHGGSITARSAPGAGASFIVILPDTLSGGDGGNRQETPAQKRC